MPVWQQGFEAALKENQGTELGASLTPLGTTDHSSYLIKAQAANPVVIIVLQAAQDAVNARLPRNLNFGLGIFLAGLVDVLAAGMLGLQPTIGSDLIMPGFVAIIIGGLGSLTGTL